MSVISPEVMAIPEKPDPDNDSDMLYQRYITVDTFRASWQADEADRKIVEESLAGLSD